ncbi:MliC family protein [Pseudoxanthomonas daejeonensis]|uniref:C-type lysozyme inhibitor domain-containing protein n=1 Tax=Pseudoxanthomonas daejeonensis TaxID=266062 RepID=A0ABQ6Z4S3_9GAMM|nr:MliC family protein [Pseudoxanthomonas daejeonensis]KAF1693061.1 hypothetical protein CSC65_13190 [Pseudoxanthomonas daejeonensis]UNK57459.1 MliC family protein [Pseudoxanthomonas daejeonensis]
MSGGAAATRLAAMASGAGLILVLAAGCRPAEPEAVVPRPAAQASPPAPAPVQPTASATAAPNPGTPVESHWQCGDQRVAARLDPASQTLTLIHERGQLALPQSVATSGTRYADENGNEFRSGESGATLTLSGTPARECSQVTNGASG